MAPTVKDSQLNLPPVEVRGSEQDRPAFRKSEQDAATFRTTEQDDVDGLAASLFDEALTAAALTNKEVAHLLGVSVSLVEKMRSTEARGCPSFVQMLRLPPAFHLELHRAMNRRFGFGRQLLRRILDDLSDLAVVTER